MLNSCCLFNAPTALQDYFPILWKEFIDASREIYENNAGDMCNSILPKIECPSLIVQGNKDAMVSDEHPDYLLQNIKNARYVISVPPLL